MNWLFIGTVNYGRERYIVEYLKPEPGDSYKFRFQGISEYYRIHTYNSTLDNYSLNNKAAIPNFYFSVSMT